MRVKIVLLLFLVYYVCGVYGEGSKFKGFDLKPLGSGVQQNKDNIPNGSSYQSIVAYYVGILENKNGEQSYDVQFQLRLWADQSTQKIHVQIDEWNEKYSDSGNFELDFYYNGNRKWCNIYSECTIPFVKEPTQFTVDINAADGNYFHLLYFSNFNNSFALNDPIGKCTKDQLEGLYDNYLPNYKLAFCVCGDNYAPDELLGCPNDKWSSGTETTPNPITITPPKPKNITCNTVVGYYNGLFKNYWDVENNIEFEIRVNADDTTQKVYYYFNHWNEQKSNSSQFKLVAWNGEDWGPWCDSITKSNCSVPYVDKETKNLVIDLNTGPGINNYDILYFPDFYNALTLTNAIGQCTKNQYQNPENSAYNPDQKLYEYCLCCGNTYDPDMNLGCPKNPWAVKKTTPQSITTTPKPITIASPQPKDITCKNVVGYYHGIFQNTEYPTVLKNVEFQIRVNANDTKRRVYFYIDKWNEQKSSLSEFQLVAWDGETEGKCYPISNSSCSLPYVNKEKDHLYIILEHWPTRLIRDAYYYFLTFPNFFHALTLTNVVGQCTKSQYQNPKNSGYIPNGTLYEYCLCCGDNYNPDPSLGCPKNPWV